MWSRGHQGTRRRKERRRETSLEGEGGREAHIKGGNSWWTYGRNMQISPFNAMLIIILAFSPLELFTTLSGEFSDGSYQQTYIFVGVCGLQIFYLPPRSE